MTSLRGIRTGFWLQPVAGNESEVTSRPDAPDMNSTLKMCMTSWVGMALAALLLASCARDVSQRPQRPARIVYTPASFAALEGWQGDDPTAAFLAFGRSCEKFQAQPATRPVGPKNLGIAVADWQPACAAAKTADPANAAGLRKYFEDHFLPVAISLDRDPGGLFTGYYEPELKASLTCGGPYQTPIYRRPPDLVTVDLGLFKAGLEGQDVVGRVRNGKLVPYDKRSSIYAGALAGRGLELACAADAKDVFFLEIQGSGRLLLEDGRVMQVGFDGKNGHPYVAIGGVLVRQGHMKKEDVTLQSIRAWLTAHPEQAQAVLEANPSYVFFRRLSGKYPVGALGVELTPGRSIAIDRSVVPLGAPVWLETALPPLGAAVDGPSFQRLMVAQDTGGAIKGAVRADIFWGAGGEAEALAGAMKQRGRYFVLLPRGVALRLKSLP